MHFFIVDTAEKNGSWKAEYPEVNCDFSAKYTHANSVSPFHMHHRVIYFTQA